MTFAPARTKPSGMTGEHRTATEPAELRGAGRDDVRLLVTDRERLDHRRFADLPKILAPGDLLVVNTSATLPAALGATGGLRVHVSTSAPGGYHIVEVRTGAGPASRPLGEPPPDVVTLEGGGSVELIAPFPNGEPGRLWLARLRVATTVPDYLAQHGMPIRYPYITEPWPLAAYQTVFSTTPGSAEMPSAGRPFTAPLVTRLVASGIGVAPLLLHTGVSSLESGEPPYPEWFSVPPTTARAVNVTHRGGGRVIAVGTTVVRALESVADDRSETHPGHGWTDLVIDGSRGLRAVDGLVTGWHEPESSHLAILQALAGRRAVDASYAAAAEHGYLWHEFGDVHLLFGREGGARRTPSGTNLHSWGPPSLGTLPDNS